SADCSILRRSQRGSARSHSAALRCRTAVACPQARGPNPIFRRTVSFRTAPPRQGGRKPRARRTSNVGTGLAYLSPCARLHGARPVRLVSAAVSYRARGRATQIPLPTQDNQGTYVSRRQQDLRSYHPGRPPPQLSMSLMGGERIFSVAGGWFLRR